MSRRLLAGWLVLICAGLLLRATTVEAGDGKPPAAKEAPGKVVFGATKALAIHLEIPAKEYEAMQPPAPAFGPPGGAPPAPRGNRQNERNLFGTEFFWAEADFSAEGKTYKKVGLRLLAIKDVREKYQKLVSELSEKSFTKEQLLKEIAEVEKVTKEPLAREKKAAEPRREAPPAFGPPGAAAPQAPDLKTFAEKRSASVAAQLAGKSKGYVPAGFGFGPPAGGGGPPHSNY